MEFKTQNQLGKMLKMLRQGHNLTQSQAAVALNVERSTYAKYESGTIVVSSSMLQRLANLFGVDVNTLLGQESRPKRETLHSGHMQQHQNARFFELSDEEQELVMYFRSSDSAHKAKLLETLEQTNPVSASGKELSDRLILRPERPEDYHETELMTLRSFWNKFGPGCNEHLMVRIIRESPDYRPEFSRVAELDGKIVGAIFYTDARVTDGDSVRHVVTFGPLAVEPTLEGNGIGGVLLRETIKLCKSADVSGIVIAGEPGYYPRFGFRRCAEYHITDAEGNTSDAYQCLPLRDDFAAVSGVFTESPDFEKLKDPALLECANRDFPQYRKVKVQEGFLQIHQQHLGVVESVNDGRYMVRYWERLIPAKLSPEVTDLPVSGSDVQFDWNHKGISTITKVLHNLLED